MSKIMVTGATGFVGRHLVAELTTHRVETVAVGTNLQHGDNSVIAVDLTKPEAVKELDFKSFEGIIHLAGLAAVGPSFEDPFGYLTTNAGIEINLFEEAMRQGTRPRFLIVSTGALYAADTPLPLTETSPVSPGSPYAISKITQETIGHYYMQRGFECIIVRPFNHIGPGQGPGFIVPDLAQQIILVEQGASSSVKVGNLDAKRDYTDVRDIVRAYRLLLEKGEPGETYNVCSGVAVSGYEILEALAEAASVEPSIKQDQTKLRPSDSPLIYGSHDKLTKATGWQPQIPLKTTLNAVISDWRSR